MDRHFWTDEKRAELRKLAATGMCASDIGLILGATKPSVVTTAGRGKIPLVRHTETEIEEMRLRTEQRLKRMHDSRRKAKSSVVVIGDKVIAKTSAFYRKMLPHLPEMSKNQLREMIAEAFRNTAEASI